MTKQNKFFAVAGVVLFFIQWVPVDRENPATSENVPAPPHVRSVLERACYDCHSNESRWPWYGYVAPISWLVEHHIEEAREHINFSTWDEYDEDERIDIVEDAWEEVEEGEMPPVFYLPLHPEATLDERDRAVLREWAESVE